MKASQFARRGDVVACLTFALGAIITLACMYAAGVVPRSDDVVLRNTSDEDLARKLEGQWTFDDLRTSEIEGSEVVFEPSGAYQDEANDSIFDVRWFTDQGSLYFAYRRIDGVQDYSKDHVFRVMPVFDSSGDMLTIAFRGEEPHGKLFRKG